MHSLGVVLHRLLNGGRVPFRPADGSVESEETIRLRQQNGAWLPTPSGLDENCGDILRTLCAREPECCFADFDTLRWTLGNYLATTDPNLLGTTMISSGMVQS